MIEYEELQGSTMIKDAPSIINSNMLLVDGALNTLNEKAIQQESDIYSLSTNVNKNASDIASLSSGKLDKTGGTITGTLNVEKDSYPPMIVKRLGNAKGSGIEFHNTSDGLMGSVFCNNKDEGLRYMNSSGVSYNIAHIVASGTNYIRYSSGLQICWGSGTTPSNSGINWTYPQTYKNEPIVVVSSYSQSDVRTNVYLIGNGYAHIVCRSSNSIVSSDFKIITIGFWK